MSRRRRFRRDERHVALDLGLVGQCFRHDAGDARPVSLAVGADRAAGRGLCRSAVLSQRAAGVARPPHQYGRADLDRRGVGAWPLGLRDRDARRPRLFRFRDHAVVLPAVRALPRAGDAAEDPVVRRQSRIAQGGVRAPARWQRRIDPRPRRRIAAWRSGGSASPSRRNMPSRNGTPIFGSPWSGSCICWCFSAP